MELKINFVIWCDHSENDSNQMTEIKRNKYEITFECSDCKKQVTVNEVEVSL